MAESKEELKSLLMRVKKEFKNWPQHSKKKRKTFKILRSWLSPITLWKIDG